MRLVVIFALSFMAPSCDRGIRPLPQERSIYVGGPLEPESWPYRYTLVRTDGAWTGEIEYILSSDGKAIHFDTMKVIRSEALEIHFEALLGGPGKALPANWVISLEPTESGFDGKVKFLEDPASEAVRLRFISKPGALLPSEAARTPPANAEAAPSDGDKPTY